VADLEYEDAELTHVVGATEACALGGVSRPATLHCGAVEQTDVEHLMSEAAGAVRASAIRRQSQCQVRGRTLSDGGLGERCKTAGAGRVGERCKTAGAGRVGERP